MDDLYVGFLERVVRLDNEYFIAVDSVLEKDIAQRPGDTPFDVPTLYLTATVAREQFWSRQPPREGRWIRFRLGGEGERGFPADAVDPASDADEASAYVSGVEPLPRQASVQYSEFCRRHLRESHELPAALLDWDPEGHSTTVRCIRVRQGTAALISGPSVRFLADVGPRRGLPAELAAADGVVLTHWHFDHYGRAMAGGVRADWWVVPEHGRGPSPRKLCDQIVQSGGQLHYVRRDPPAQLFDGAGLRLVKAGGKSTNNSGLALLVETSLGSVLLPGDADYNVIGAISAGPVYGLVATHHGAEFRGAPPKPGSLRDHVVLSYGRENRYKHPRPNALDKYASSKWRLFADLNCGDFVWDRDGGHFLDTVAEYYCREIIEN